MTKPPTDNELATAAAITAARLTALEAQIEQQALDQPLFRFGRQKPPRWVSPQAAHEWYQRRRRWRIAKDRLGEL